MAVASHVTRPGVRLRQGVSEHPNINMGAKIIEYQNLYRLILFIIVMVLFLNRINNYNGERRCAKLCVRRKYKYNCFPYNFMKCSLLDHTRPGCRENSYKYNYNMFGLIGIRYINVNLHILYTLQLHIRYISELMIK